jgi:hypothetical protein
MSFFSAVNGYQIVCGSLVIPLVGVWTADLTLANAPTLSGKVSVTIGNLTLAGTVYRSEQYGNQVKCRLVGGAGGWRSSIPVQGYGSSNGIMMSTVLNDAAAACGETVNVANDQSIGNGYARVSFDTSVASDVLWHMIDLGFMPAWYVDVNGTTQNVAWPSSTVGTPFLPTSQHPDQGMIEIATEDYASWLPGCSFSHPLLSGTYTSSGVHYVWDEGGKFRFEVLTQTSPTDSGDRVLGPIQQVIQKETAPMRLMGKYRYTISNPSTSTIDCSPKNTKLGLPSLQNVPLMSDSISTYTPPNGGDCIIEFLDGYIPVCSWTAGTATVCNLLGGSNPVARLGDQTMSFLPPSLPLDGTVSGSPFAGTVTIPTPISGVITQGSQEVNSL